MDIESDNLIANLKLVDIYKEMYKIYLLSKTIKKSVKQNSFQALVFLSYK